MWPVAPGCSHRCSSLLWPLGVLHPAWHGSCFHCRPWHWRAEKEIRKEQIQLNSPKLISSTASPRFAPRLPLPTRTLSLQDQSLRQPLPMCGSTGGMEHPPQNLHLGFSSLCFTWFLAATARLLVLLRFPCSYQQGRVAARSCAPHISFFQQSASRARGDKLPASVLTARVGCPRKD